jgi:hypothetical protein
MSEFDLAHPGWMNDRRMLSKPLTAEEFDDLVRPVVGLEVSRTWKGHGTAIFLELGALTPTPSVRGRYRDKGEAKVACGSASDREEIEAGIATLLGKTIRSIAVVGTIPELRVEFSDGRCLQSMVLFDDDPQWALFLPDGRWLSANAGSLGVHDGSGGSTPEEKGEA